MGLEDVDRLARDHAEKRVGVLSQSGEETNVLEAAARSSDEDEREDVERAEASMECYVGPRITSRAPSESPCVSKAS
jgi:hypothetical protein